MRGTVGFGYRWAPARQGPEPNPDELKVLRRILDLRLAGTHLKAIAETLNHEGIRSRMGKPWTLNMVRNQILRLEDEPNLRSLVVGLAPT